MTSVEPLADIMIGEPVCMYGRASNVRDCGLTVSSKGAICSLPGQPTVYNVVKMSDWGEGTAGDSGGGWSWGNKAYGSVVGICASKAAFSVADLFDEALGVRVRLSHTLPTAMVLEPDDGLVSADARFIAKMQLDGNFVLYKNGLPIWASSWCGQTGYSSILGVMQSDGNFVLYPNGSTTAVWATSWSQTQPGCSSDQQTVFAAGTIMVMQDDGNLVMYRPGYIPVWATNTGGQ